MSVLLSVSLFVIFFACVACAYAEGIWGNVIRLINVVTAGLLATNFFEPTAEWFESMFPSYTYACDFLALWGVFAVSLVLMRTITETLSRVKVRFMKIVDQIGGAVLACWVGWVMVCFTLMTLHTAPLAANFMFGAFEPDQRMFLGLAPDRQWLAFTQKVSRGSFSRSADEQYVFDPEGEFMLRYYARRIDVENQVRARDTIRVNK